MPLWDYPSSCPVTMRRNLVSLRPLSLSILILKTFWNAFGHAILLNVHLNSFDYGDGRPNFWKSKRERPYAIYWVNRKNSSNILKMSPTL